MLKRFFLAGIVAALFCGGQTARAGLVANGGFESGDFTGWTQTGDTDFTGVQGNFGGVNPPEGKFQAFFGPIGSLGSISQTFATTAGAHYTISFDLFNFGGTPSVYQVQWNGALPLLSGVDSGPFPYTAFTATVLGTGSDTLAFNFQQNPLFFLLDNVDVTATTVVPEPATLVMWSLMAGFFGVGRLRKRAKQTAMAA